MRSSERLVRALRFWVAFLLAVAELGGVRHLPVMSLETVELVEHVEAAFGIHVPDSVASDLFTVGRLHEFVLSELRARGEQPDPQHIWERLVQVFVAEHGVSARLVVPGAHIVYDLGMD